MAHAVQAGMHEPYCVMIFTNSMLYDDDHYQQLVVLVR